MKSKLAILLFSVFLSKDIYAQNAYYAAVGIRNNCIDGNALTFKRDAASVLQLADYLRSVLPDATKKRADLNTSQICTIYQGNPFFGAAVNFCAGGGSSNPRLLGAALSLPSSAGSMNVTNIADGIAQFLVERAKEELFVSFIDKIQNFLDNKAPELDTLFPNTRIVLKNFKSWEYANMLNTLRASVDKDLQQLMGNIISLKNLDTTGHNYSKTVRARVQKLKNFLVSDNGKIFLSICRVGNGFINGEKTPDILHAVATDPGYLQGIGSLNADEKNSIKLLEIISTSLESTDAGRNYITQAQLTALYTDPILSSLYFGLLYQQINQNNIVIGGTNIAAGLTPGHVDGFKTYITNMVDQGEDVNAAIDNLKDAKKKGIKDLSTYWEAILQSSNQFLVAASNIGTIDPALSFSVNVQKIFTGIEQVFGIGQDIAIHNYNAAVVGTLTLVDSYLDPNSEIGEVMEGFTKYVSFAANLVAAQSSADAKNAIEAIALPVGSSSIKKNSHFNIALNAYLGGFWGNEYIPALQSGKWSPIAGVTAPIGITFSKPLVINNCSWGSASLFLSLLDVGAFASYRLSDTSTTKLPNVTLANIWAPGFGLVWGLPKV
ncbi:MAG TPA: hypothetical protein VGM41_07425, partial [Chitinophagaceae bacterium]